MARESRSDLALHVVIPVSDMGNDPKRSSRALSQRDQDRRLVPLPHQIFDPPAEDLVPPVRELLARILDHGKRQHIALPRRTASSAPGSATAGSPRSHGRKLASLAVRTGHLDEARALLVESVASEDTAISTQTVTFCLIA